MILPARTWECPECGRRFTREADLRRHARTHYVIRPRGT